MKRVYTANSMMVTPWICLNLRTVIVQQASGSRETEKSSHTLEKWVESILPPVASTKFEKTLQASSNLETPKLLSQTVTVSLEGTIVTLTIYNSDQY